jgi:hypothetical protein
MNVNGQSREKAKRRRKPLNIREQEAQKKILKVLRAVPTEKRAEVLRAAVMLLSLAYPQTRLKL